MSVDSDSRTLSDAEAIVRRLWYLIDARDWVRVRGLLADDFSSEAPVSGERFVGPDTFVRMNAEYPGGWALTVVRVVADGERAASEVRFRLHGKIDTALSFYEIRDGKLGWEADWWPEPYPAPASRAMLVSPPAPPDPRFRHLDVLDDARGDLLDIVEATEPNAFLAPLQTGPWRAVDLLNHLSGWDVRATENVIVLAADQSPPGWGDLDEFNARSVAERRDHSVEQALAELYRARADLRLALWQAPVSVWEHGPRPSADGEDQVSLPRICQIWADHEREHLDELRSVLTGRTVES